MAKIDTIFLTRTAKKPYLLGAHIPLNIHKGVTNPTAPGSGEWKVLSSSGFPSVGPKIRSIIEMLTA